MNYIYALAALALLWNLSTVLRTLALQSVPWAHRVAAARCLLGAVFKNCLVLPFSLTAPVMVLFPLARTPFEADKLAFWDDLYGNEDSLNGDAFYRPRGFSEGVDADWNPFWVECRRNDPGFVKMSDIRYTGQAYYAKKRKPRDFRARYAWIGLRNRASRLAQRLGPTFTPEEQADRESWGDLATGRGTPGWVLNRAGRWYQFYASARLLSFSLRGKTYQVFCWTNFGYKVGEKVPPEGEQNKDAMVVGIAAALYVKVS